MKITTWGRRAVMAGLAAGMMALAAPVAAQSISGNYRAEGRNPDGTPYSGVVTIREEGAMVYIAWRVGNQGYNGTGTRNGDIIWIDWGSDYPIVYLRMPSGQLHGTWANGTALERLVR